MCQENMSHLMHTGISQSYISQWLLQQGLEMSDSKRRAFYRWYLLERNNPGEKLVELECRTIKFSFFFVNCGRRDRCCVTARVIMRVKIWV